MMIEQAGPSPQESDPRPTLSEERSVRGGDEGASVTFTFGPAGEAYVTFEYADAAVERAARR